MPRATQAELAQKDILGGTLSVEQLNEKLKNTQPARREAAIKADAQIIAPPKPKKVGWVARGQFLLPAHC